MDMVSLCFVLFGYIIIIGEFFWIIYYHSGLFLLYNWFNDDELKLKGMSKIEFNLCPKYVHSFKVLCCSYIVRL